MNIQLDVRIILPALLGFAFGWLMFAGDGTPIIVNIETNEKGKHLWMQERIRLHNKIYDCEHPSTLILKENNDELSKDTPISDSTVSN